MKETQFKVLKALSEATSRMDINMFAKKVNLDPNQTIQQVQDLAREGFLQKVGSGFGITAKGKAALKAFVPVPEGMVFHFYNGIDKPTDLEAKTLWEFYGDVKQVAPARRSEQLVLGGIIDDRLRDRVLVPQGDRHGVLWESVDEVGRPVERIDDPGVLGIALAAGLAPDSSAKIAWSDCGHSRPAGRRRLKAPPTKPSARKLFSLDWHSCRKRA